MSLKEGQGVGVLPSQAPDASSRVALLDSLPPDARAMIEAAGRLQEFTKGDLIFRQGEPHEGIILIETGMIRSFYSAPNGREITLAYWLPGNFVGGPDVFSGGVHMWSAAAVRKSRVLHLAGGALRDLARTMPDIALAIIDALVFKARCYSSLAQMLGTRTMKQRLAQVLLHLVHIYGFQPPGAKEGVAIAAAFTHSEIATMIGSTRQWVTISLNQLQDQGVLSQKRGVMTVFRPDVISTMATDDGISA